MELNKNSNNNLNLTEPAAREIRKILSDFPVKERYLRFGIKPGGCSGFTYCIDMCSTPNTNDRELEINGLRIVCDPVSWIYIEGSTIDFRDDQMNRGFIFNNPNAKKNCSCGISFGV